MHIMQLYSFFFIIDKLTRIWSHQVCHLYRLALMALCQEGKPACTLIISIWVKGERFDCSLLLLGLYFNLNRNLWSRNVSIFFFFQILSRSHQFRYRYHELLSNHWNISTTNIKIFVFKAYSFVDIHTWFYFIMHGTFLSLTT